MRALVDAQLPRRLAYRLRELGHDAAHTLDLPDGNRTTDLDIARVADAEERVVVTKDSDFVASRVLRGTPARLLLISTGNLPNQELEALLLPVLDEIADAFEETSFVELTRTTVFFDT